MWKKACLQAVVQPMLFDTNLFRVKVVPHPCSFYFQGICFPFPVCVALLPVSARRAVSKGLKTCKLTSKPWVTAENSSQPKISQIIFQCSTLYLFETNFIYQVPTASSNCLPTVLWNTRLTSDLWKAGDVSLTGCRPMQNGVLAISFTESAINLLLVDMFSLWVWN